MEIVRDGVTRVVVVVLGFSGASPSLVNWVFVVDLGATRDEVDDDEDEDLTGASPSLENCVFVCLGATRGEDDDDDEEDDDDDDLIGASPSLTSWVVPAGLEVAREGATA